MSDERITLYTKGDPETAIACDRNHYYDNDLTKYANYYPALIDVFLFNSHGDVLLQRRGRDRRKNPYMLHTSVGGHINWGERPEFSLVHESMEELGAPVLLFEKQEYFAAVQKLHLFTQKAAMVYQVKEYFRDFRASEVEARRRIKDRIWLYFGLYDGPVHSPDRASAGYEWIGLEALTVEMQRQPENFTSGLATYIQELESEMKQFILECSRHAKEGSQVAVNT